MVVGFPRINEYCLTTDDLVEVLDGVRNSMAANSVRADNVGACSWGSNSGCESPNLAERHCGVKSDDSETRGKGDLRGLEGFNECDGEQKRRDYSAV